MAILFILSLSSVDKENVFKNKADEPSYEKINSAYDAVQIGLSKLEMREKGRNSEYDYATAKKYFRRALELNPRERLAWYGIGMAAFTNGHFYTALESFNSELEILKDPLYEHTNVDDTPVLYMISLTNGFIKNFELAANGFTHLIEINANDPRSWAYYTDLAWVYFQQGKFEEIKEIMEGGILLGDDSVPNNEREVDVGGYARYPDNPWVLNMYALALHNLGETERAHELLLHAYEEVQKLTTDDWVRAYPGNDPEIAPVGLEDFMSTIRKNIDITI